MNKLSLVDHTILEGFRHKMLAAQASVMAKLTATARGHINSALNHPERGERSEQISELIAHLRIQKEYMDSFFDADRGFYVPDSEVDGEDPLRKETRRIRAKTRDDTKELIDDLVAQIEAEHC